MDDHELAREALVAASWGGSRTWRSWRSGRRREALSLASVWRPDLVLMDVRMPDGWTGRNAGYQADAARDEGPGPDDVRHAGVRAGGSAGRKRTATCSRAPASRSCSAPFEQFCGANSDTAGPGHQHPPPGSTGPGRGRRRRADWPPARRPGVDRGRAEQSGKIASELHLSLNTVKTHVVHVLRRLEVTDRERGTGSGPCSAARAPGRSVTVNIGDG